MAGGPGGPLRLLLVVACCAILIDGCQYYKFSPRRTKSSGGSQDLALSELWVSLGPNSYTANTNYVPSGWVASSSPSVGSPSQSNDNNVNTFFTDNVWSGGATSLDIFLTFPGANNNVRALTYATANNTDGQPVNFELFGSTSPSGPWMSMLTVTNFPTVTGRSFFTDIFINHRSDLITGISPNVVARNAIASQLTITGQVSCCYGTAIRLYNSGVSGNAIYTNYPGYLSCSGSNIQQTVTPDVNGVITVGAIATTGTVRMCVSLDNGNRWQLQDITFTVAAVSLPGDAITLIPNVFPTGVTFSLALLNKFPYAFPTTTIAFAVPGSCASSRFGQTTLSNGVSATLGSAITQANTYRLCTSLSNNGDWTESTFDVLVVAANTFLSVSPSLISINTLPIINYISPRYVPTAVCRLGFAPTSDCSSPLAISTMTKGDLNYVLPTALGVGTYYGCYSVGGGFTATPTAVLTVVDNSGTVTLTPTVATAGTQVTFTITGVQFTPTMAVAFTTSGNQGDCASSAPIVSPTVQLTSTSTTVQWPVTLSAGTYSLCYSTNSQDWVFKASLLVINTGNNLITSPSSFSYTEGAQGNVQFSGSFVYNSGTAQIGVAVNNMCAAPLATTFYNGGMTQFTLSVPAFIVTRPTLVVCFAADGVNFVQQTGVTGVLNIARSLSITSVSPRIIIVGAPISVQFTGAVNSGNTYVALSNATVPCSTTLPGTAVQYTGATQTAFGSPIYATGTIYVCYSVNGPSNYVPQYLATMTSSNDLFGSTLFTMSFTAVGLNQASQISFVASTAVAPTALLAFAPPGQCLTSRVGLTSWPSGTTAPINLGSGIGAIGHYSVCFQNTTAQQPAWSEQGRFGIFLDVVDANGGSITAIAPNTLGVGVSIAITYTGLVVTPTTRLQLASGGTCTSGTLVTALMPSSNTITHPAFSVAGTYLVCYDTGSGYVQQGGTIRVVGNNNNMITSIDPNVAGVNSEVMLTFANNAGQAACSTCALGIAPVGTNCAAGGLKNFVNYTVDGPVQLQNGVPAGTYSVCFRAGNAWTEQTGITLVLVASNATMFSHLTPNIIGKGTQLQMTATIATSSFPATAYVAAVVSTGNCGDAFARQAVTLLTANTFTLSAPLAPAANQAYTLCFTVNAGASGEVWFAQTLVSINVRVATSQSITQIAPLALGQGSNSLMTLTGAAGFSTSYFGFSLAVDACAGGPDSRYGITPYPVTAPTALSTIIPQPNNYILCWSVDLGQTWAPQFNVSTGYVSITVINALPLSISGLDPAVFGADTTPVVHLISSGGPLATDTSWWALSLKASTCSTGPRFVETLYNVEGSFGELSAPLSGGVYKICFSTDNRTSWVDQTATTVTVVEGTNSSITEITPRSVLEGTANVITFSGSPASADSFVSLMLSGGNCSKASDRVGTTAYSASTLDLGTHITVNGLYSVCYTANNGSSWFEQSSNLTKIWIVGANAYSLTSILPKFIGYTMVSGATVVVADAALPTSTVGFAFVNGTTNHTECENSQIYAATALSSLSEALSSVLPYPGHYHVCYSTDLGTTWYTQQTTNMHIDVLVATPTSVTGVYPTVLEAGVMEPGLYFEGISVTATSKVAFGQVNSGCNLPLSVMAYTGVGATAMTSAIFQPGTYSVCYSVNNGQSYVEQPNARVTVINCRQHDSCGTCAAATYCNWCLVDNRCALNNTCTDGGTVSVVPTGGDCPTASAVTDTGAAPSGSVTGGTILTLNSSLVVNVTGYQCRWLLLPPASPLLLNASAVDPDAQTISCVAPSVADTTNTLLVTLYYRGAPYSTDNILFRYYSCAQFTSCESCNTPLSAECGFCLGTTTCQVHSLCTGDWAIQGLCPAPAALIIPPAPQQSAAGAIAGAVIAAIVVVIVAIAFFIFYRREQKRKNRYAPPPLSTASMTTAIYGTPRQQTAESASILQHLARFEQLLLMPGADLAMSIASATQSTEADNISKAMVIIMEANGATVPIMKEFITNEVSNSLSQSTLFRTNSFATKMFKTYSKIVGLPYVHRTIGFQVNEAVAHAEENALNVKVSGDNDDKFVFLGTCQKFFRAITQSVEDVPPSFRIIFSHLLQELQRCFPIRSADLAVVVSENLVAQMAHIQISFMESAFAYKNVEGLQKEIEKNVTDLKQILKPMQNHTSTFATRMDNMNKRVSDMKKGVDDLQGALDPSSAAAARILREHGEIQNSIAVGGFFFLRFLVPAITSPETFHLVRDLPDEKGRQVLVMVGKVLQTMSNGKEFGDKEANMEKLNEFIIVNRKNMNKLLADLAIVQDVNLKTPPAAPVPQDHRGAALILLFQHVNKLKDKIANAMAASHAGEDQALVQRRRQMKLAFDLTMEEINSKVSGTELSLAATAVMETKTPGATPAYETPSSATPAAAPSNNVEMRTYVPPPPKPAGQTDADLFS